MDDIVRKPSDIQDAQLLIQQLEQALSYAQQETKFITSKTASLETTIAERKAQLIEERKYNDNLAHRVAELQERVAVTKEQIKSHDSSLAKLKLQELEHMSLCRELHALVLGLAKLILAQSRQLSDARARWVTVTCNRVSQEYERRRQEQLFKVSQLEYEMLGKAQRTVTEATHLAARRVREMQTQTEEKIRMAVEAETRVQLQVLEAVKFRAETVALMQALYRDWRAIDEAIVANLAKQGDMDSPERKRLEEELKRMEAMYEEIKRKSGFSKWS